MHQSLQLNIIPFTPLQTQVTIYFYKERFEGSVSIHYQKIQGVLNNYIPVLEQAEQIIWFKNRYRAKI